MAIAKVAQATMAKSMQVFKDFYAQAEVSTLIQGTHRWEQKMTQTSKVAYKGMASGGGNLVDFLDVILSDLARLEHDTFTTHGCEASSTKLQTKQMMVLLERSARLQGMSWLRHSSTAG